MGANQCVNVIRDPLVNQFIYIYATDVFGQPLLSGTTSMCVGTRRFVIRGDKDCWVNGYEAAPSSRSTRRRRSAGRCSSPRGASSDGRGRSCMTSTPASGSGARRSASDGRGARRRRIFAGLGLLAVAGVALGFYLTADKWSIDLDDDLVAVEVEDPPSPPTFRSMCRPSSILPATR